MAFRDKLTDGEMEVVMTVFRQFETGLREACIDVKVCVRMKSRNYAIYHCTPVQ